MLPRRLEVDRVHEGQARELVQDALPDELGDALLRLFGDPAVDGLAGILGGADVVDEAHSGPEASGEGLQIGLLEGVVALGERRVRDAEQELVVGALVIGDGAVALGEGGLEGVEPGRMLVRCGVVHDGVHLGRRVAARARSCHAQRERDARGGEDGVLGVVSARDCAAVEVEAEGVDRGGGLRGVVGGGLGSGKVGGGELDGGGAGGARRDDEGEGEERGQGASHTARTRRRARGFHCGSRRSADEPSASRVASRTSVDLHRKDR